MYKVFINDKPLLITSPANNISEVGNTVLVQYENENTFKKIVAELHLNEKTAGAIVISIDVENAWSVFCSAYRIVHAAGGIVLNPQNEYLLILRYGKWDLPKGKIEKGENHEAAALREIEEETGVKGGVIIHPLPATFHTHKMMEKNILKQTHWYLIHAPAQELSPQAEEAIEKAIWCSREDFFEKINTSYKALREMVSNANL
jgi:8-oxo-dGTP pyrophosphatase MutT (NUDIX family)